ncbi:ABC transporter permease [Eisenibacter elegans]|jgi:lipopolysaccharide transport system permease protein|uniref:ABC transporter permease n=1 Tax=Eisenibacter elegans TaxID=997 RepID=UPI000416D602|nr:ABC transporter permease [Eisenibacter elegans]
MQHTDTSPQAEVLPSEQGWTEVIAPHAPWWDLRLGELWRYRDLILLFVWRDFVSVYKQTILGPLWHIIQPLTTTVVFVVVFGNIAGLSTDGQPAFLFYMAGVTIWNYFAGCLNRTSSTFVDNAAIFGKVYFPRMAVPLANVISGLLAFGIQLGVFLCLYAFFALRGEALQPNWWLLTLPYLVLMMALLGLGLGILISSLTTKYRDLTQLVGFGVQLLMYATPVIYPMSSLSPRWQQVMAFNPIAPIVEAFRYAFLGTGVFNASMLFYNAVVTVVILLLSLVLFNRVERNFMDTV